QTNVGLTGADGTYLYGGLLAGSYKVAFSKTGAFRVFYNNKLDSASADLLSVTSGVLTPNVNAVMSGWGTISGKVISSTTGSAIAGATVTLYNQNGTPVAGVSSVSTKADGSYTLKKLTPGTNQVEFVPGGVFSSCGNNGNYLPVSLSATITSQATTTLDAILPAGGTISGTVTGQNGQPLSGVCVFSSSQFGGQAVSKADGSFRLRQLFSGSYFVGYEGGCGNQGSVAPQAYQGDPTFFGPASITVTQGSVTAGIDARMKPGATITGRITNRAGHPVGDVCVFLNPVTGAGAGGNFGLGVLDRQGRFSAGNLPPGQYQVIYSGMFNPRRGCARSPYADWQFGGTGVGAAPGLISARGGTVTTGANAILPPAGRISGTVTDTAGRALPNLCVQAIAASGAGTFAGTSRHGTYTLGALPPGRYKVEFTSCSGDFVFFGQTGLNYASQWYKNKLSRASASVVVVRPSVTTTGIDGALARGGSVSGQVTYRPNGRPVSFVCVDALSDRGGVLTDHFALTDRRGHYLVDGLGTDRYELEFQPCSGESALTSAIKGGVSVVAGQLRRGVNSALALGASVSGTTSALVNGTAQAAPGTCVFAVPARPNSVPVAAFAQQGGAYTATGAAAGQYVLVAGDPFCSVDAPWLTMKVGPNFTVKAGQTTSGVDTSLQVAGAITGAVHGGGNALRGICAEAYPMAGGLGIPVGVTSGAGGQYQITDLQPGQYKIRFAAGCGASGWATRWYKNARTEVGGTVVRVHPAAVTTGIDATLPRG
ncbi:MAG TPA: carboxypeptidase regulatory-like domain-containing protein, partial [Streptosporangiaceae bacterium]